MTPKGFFDNVAKMREAQKRYFKTREHGALIDSKRYEAMIDAEIERVQRIVEEQARKSEQALFDNQ